MYSPSIGIGYYNWICMVNFGCGGVVLKKDQQVLYFYMISVTIGTVIIALAIIKYIVGVNEPKGFLIILLGFLLTINYINYLEKKAGISKKIILIKNSVYMVLVGCLTYFLYF